MDVQSLATPAGMMQVAFRADASLHIGTGHVMRCLTLADVLRQQGATCSFICRPHSGHLIDLIEQRGHSTKTLPPPDTTEKPKASPATGPAQPAADIPKHASWLGTNWSTDAQQTRQALGHIPVDWLVVDHYALDARWEQALRPACHRLMVIDDLADRPHHCHLLLDQNLGRTAAHYARHLPPGTPTLIGPAYALLRPEFAQLRAISLARRAPAQLTRLLITMGGVDKDNATGQVLESLKSCRLPGNISITVVMGPHAPWLAQVQEQARHMPWPTQVLAGVSHMAQLMTDSDLCIGAAGATAWERCCLGLPSIQLVLAENQKEAAFALTALQAAQSINLSPQFTEDLKAIFVDTCQQQLSTLAERSAAICSGSGAQTVGAHLMASTC